MTKNIIEKTKVQRWGLRIVFCLFVISLVLYIVNFHENGISQYPEEWGQFGDYMGGIINPIVGLITIWLLTVSLEQNHIALEQAHEELRLAKKALEETKEMQSMTANALKKQITIAEQTRDMQNTIVLWNHLNSKLKKNEEALKKQIIKKNEQEIKTIRGSLLETSNLAKSLDGIINREIQRLIDHHSN